jgi:site-specific DNA recombinase
MNLNLEEFEEKFAEEYRKYREQKEKEFYGVLN